MSNGSAKAMDLDQPTPQYKPVATYNKHDTKDDISFTKVLSKLQQKKDKKYNTKFTKANKLVQLPRRQPNNPAIPKADNNKDEPERRFTVDLRATYQASADVVRAHEAALQELATYDGSLIVISTKNSNLDSIQHASRFPRNQREFNDFLLVKRDNNQYNSITVFCRIQLNTDLNEIKFKQGFSTWLIKHKVFFQQDLFNTQDIRSVGYLLNVHPGLVHRTSLEIELREQMETALLDKNTLSTLANEGFLLIEEEDAIIPKLEIQSRKTRVRDGDNFLSTTVLEIISTTAETEYLQNLLPLVDLQVITSTGKFAPKGLARMANEEIMRALLVQHESLIRKMTVVPIIGLSRAATEATVRVQTDDDDHEITVKAWFQKHIDTLMICETTRTDTEGLWFLICFRNTPNDRKYQLNTVKDFIDTDVKELFQGYLLAEWPELQHGATNHIPHDVRNQKDLRSSNM